MLEAAGTGCLLTVSVVYFHGSVGIPAGAVGMALFVSGAVALAAGVPTGMLADRFGPRRVLVGALLAQAAAMAALVLATSACTLAAGLSAAAIAERAAYAARGALMAEAFRADRVASRARMRAVGNLGMVAGGAVGGLALHAGSATALRAAILLNAVGFAASAVLARKLPALAPKGGGPAGERAPAPVLKDRRFLALTAVNAAVCLHYGLFEVAMPLWVVEHTAAPRWLVSVLVMANTGLVVVLQVRLSRGSDDAPGGARSIRRAGLLLLVACVGFGWAGRLPGWAAVLAMLTAGTVYTVAEMLQAAGSWGVSYALSPEDQHGEYQGAFGTGAAAGTALAPVFATELVLRGEGLGWIAAGALLYALCLALTPLTRTGRSEPARVPA
ncbi:MFS transporter [Kitasatospora sp. MMS16-BH015]|uniref:MFS transporter n=1 Tax=Kitasatospora sp. MMS16-BH015 TaxID=2018025 RepID=UPI00131A4DF3|nr:MFS transporter [Kitasatospora sp. MMS16-BH015]